MKKIFIIAAMVAALTSCEKVDVSDLVGDSDDATSEIGDGVGAKTKKFTFTMKGDFTNEWKAVTRGYLSADGKDLTDVWVFDYMVMCLCSRYTRLTIRLLISVSP